MTAAAIRNYPAADAPAGAAGAGGAAPAGILGAGNALKLALHHEQVGR